MKKRKTRRFPCWEVSIRKYFSPGFSSPMKLKRNFLRIPLIKHRRNMKKKKRKSLQHFPHSFEVCTRVYNYTHTTKKKLWTETSFSSWNIPNSQSKRQSLAESQWKLAVLDFRLILTIFFCFVEASCFSRKVIRIWFLITNDWITCFMILSHWWWINFTGNSVRT